MRYHFTPNAVRDVLSEYAKPQAAEQPGASSAYRTIHLALKGQPIPEEGLALDFTDEGVAWLREVGVLMPLRKVTIEKLRELCDAGETGACEELDRRGVEMPMVEPDPVVEERPDLTPFQAQVRDMLAEEFASVQVGITASGAVVFTIYADSPDGEADPPVGVVMVAADDTTPLVDGREAKRRIFLSKDSFFRVRDVWRSIPSLARRLPESNLERVEDGYVVSLDEVGIDHVRELGIGIVDYPEGGVSSERGQELEGRRS